MMSGDLAQAAQRPVAPIELGNHIAAVVSRSDRASIRAFYNEVLGGETLVANDTVDRLRLGTSHLCFVWQDAPSKPELFLGATWLELKTQDVPALVRRVQAFGVKVLDVPDPHLYFQAPGGQVYRVVGDAEDLSIYESGKTSRPNAEKGDAPAHPDQSILRGSDLSHERRGVHVSSVVAAGIGDVWDAFTTSAGAETFFAPRVRIELSLGGPYEVFFNPVDEVRSTKGKQVLSYEPGSMVSFEWTAPPELPAVRSGKTWVVVRLASAGPIGTQVHISHLGYGTGPEWDRARAHFQQGWSELIDRLRLRFESGPIDWTTQPMMWKKRERGAADER
jgi:uncharacterized protein YndB with AHSA1/START domain